MSTATATPTITSLRHLLQVIGHDGTTLPDDDPELTAWLEEAKAQALITYTLGLGAIFSSRTRWRLTEAGRHYLDTDEPGDLQPVPVADAPPPPPPPPPAPPMPVVHEVPVPYIEHPMPDATEEEELEEGDHPYPHADAPGQQGGADGADAGASGTDHDPHAGAAHVEAQGEAQGQAAELVAFVNAALLAWPNIDDLRTAIGPGIERARLAGLCGGDDRKVLAFTRRNLKRWAAAPHRFRLANLPNS